MKKLTPNICLPVKRKCLPAQNLNETLGVGVAIHFQPAKSHLLSPLFQSHPQTMDVTQLHDWTIPDSHYITRPSLLKVVGINDPNDVGEVRISFGAFLAAGSGELGSLSRTSPDRPRVR